MKRINRLILGGVFIVAVVASFSWGAGVDITVTDSFAVADTAVGVIRTDTGVSTAFYIGDLDVRALSFHYRITADTDWVADTFFINLQSSFDGIHWKTFVVDTVTDSDTSMANRVIDLAATPIGIWLRAEVAHWDSVDADEPGLVTNVYTYDCRLEVIVWK